MLRGVSGSIRRFNFSAANINGVSGRNNAGCVYSPPSVCWLRLPSSFHLLPCNHSINYNVTLELSVIFNYLIYQAKFQRLTGWQVIIPLRCRFYLFHCFSGIFSQYCVEPSFASQNVVGNDFDIGCLSFHPAAESRLMYHDFRIGKRQTFSLRPSCQ